MPEMIIGTFQQARRKRFSHLLAELFVGYTLEKNVGV